MSDRRALRLGKFQGQDLDLKMKRPDMSKPFSERTEDEQKQVRLWHATVAYARHIVRQSKVDARVKASRAAKKGILTKTPCACGSTATEGHHEDYSKPLEVVWMCRQCHCALHAERKRAASR